MFIPRPSKYIKHPNQVVTSRAKFILFIFGWTQFWKNTCLHPRKNSFLSPYCPKKSKAFIHHLLTFLSFSDFDEDLDPVSRIIIQDPSW